MKTKATVMTIGVIVLAAISAMVSCKKAPEEAQKAGEAARAIPEQRIEGNPDRNAYFGEEHIHTSWSVDAWLFGNRLTGPDEAYKYAQGQTIKHPLG